MVQKPIFFEQVKSCILSFHNTNDKSVTDETHFLQSLCEAIESVLRMGLKCSHRLVKRKDYWNWMKSIPRICEKWEIFVHPSYLQAINHVSGIQLAIANWWINSLIANVCYNIPL